MGFDITKNKYSIAGQLEMLIGKMNEMNYTQIKEEFEHILNNANTHASDDTRAKWREAINRAGDKINIMRAITNLYLKGAQLGVNK